MVNKNVRQLNKLLILTTAIARAHNWSLNVPKERELVKKEVSRLGPIILFSSCKINEIPRELQLISEDWVENEADAIHLPINSEECIYMSQNCEEFYERDWEMQYLFVKNEGSNFVLNYGNDDDFMNMYMLGAEMELLDLDLLYENLVFGGPIPFDLRKKYENCITSWEFYNAEDILSKVSEKALYEFDNIVTQYLVNKNPGLYTIGDEVYEEIFRKICPEMPDEEIPKVSKELENYDWDELLKITSEEQSSEWVKDYVYFMSHHVESYLIAEELYKKIYLN